MWSLETVVLLERGMAFRKSRILCAHYWYTEDDGFSRDGRCYGVREELASHVRLQLSSKAGGQCACGGEKSSATKPTWNGRKG
jgi:hypothetical protein